MTRSLIKAAVRLAFAAERRGGGMGFGACLICGKDIESGPVVIADVVDDEIASHAHGWCWVDSGRKIKIPEGFAWMPTYDWVPDYAVEMLPTQPVDAPQTAG